MEMTMVLKKIAEAKEAIRRDREETEKIMKTIRRSQDRKRTLELRIRKSEQQLSDLENRRAVLTIEDRIGRIDEERLALLADFLGEHRGEIRPGKEKG